MRQVKEGLNPEQRQKIKSMMIEMNEGPSGKAKVGGNAKTAPKGTEETFPRVVTPMNSKKK